MLVCVLNILRQKIPEAVSPVPVMTSSGVLRDEKACVERIEKKRTYKVLIKPLHKNGTSMRRDIILKMTQEFRNFERKHTDIQKLDRFVVALAYIFGLENK